MSGDIAIIGMACVFPGARNLREYWENILHSVDAVSDAPPDWEAERFFDPASSTGDKTYTKRGGFLGKLAEFDPAALGIMPNSVDGTEPDHFLALAAASDALADAGYQDPGTLRERTSVIIGRGTYINRGNATALQHSVLLDAVNGVLRQLHPEYSDDDLGEIRRRLKESLPPFNADTAPGLVPNIISGRIANRLDLMGPNYVVDAACASSLVAIDLAMRDLVSGRCDMAVAGGVHASTPPVIMIIFSQLNALSRKGQIRPFDSEADGTLLGEGVGMAVLRRLEDAERDGNRIYAVLKSVGIASDGRALGLLAPRVSGEELALRRAYEDAGISPGTISLVEAHGTATPVGDSAELEALNNVFGSRSGALPTVALGSVKSMISHTMPAAGMAGLIKASLALHHKVLPPTIHCESPSPQLNLATSPFYLNTATRPWIHGDAKNPRRAGVNAFGFGGINAHAVVEEYTGPHAGPNLQHTWDSELFVMSGDSREALIEEARRLSEFLAPTTEEHSLKDLAFSQNSRPLRSVRLAIVATSTADLRTKLERAVNRLKDSKTRRIREVEGVYFFSQPLAPSGKVAFLYPGEGAQYPNTLADLCIYFPEVRQWFDRMDRVFYGHSRGHLPSQAIFPPPGHASGRLFEMDSGAEAVFCANQALQALMERLEIRPDAVAGHSTGEHTALLAAGVVRASTEDELMEHIRGVNNVFEKLNSGQQIVDGLLAAVCGASRSELDRLVKESDGRVYVALDNCPHQVLLWGKPSALEPVLDTLTERGAICQKLPFSRAYHTPHFERFAAELRRYFDSIPVAPPKIPLWSCSTAAPFPDDPAACRELASIPWARTVRFRETIEAMYLDGVRVFVEVGPRGNLTSFVDDTLRGKTYTAVAANIQSRSGILQIQHMIGQLVAHGVPVRLGRLYEDRAPRNVFDQSAKEPRRFMKVASGLQPARLPAGFSASPKNTETRMAVAAAASASSIPPPVVPDVRQSTVAMHLKTMEQFLTVQQQVMSTYLQSRQGPASPAQARTLAFPMEVLERSGDRIRAVHRFDLTRQKLFLDHTLGRGISGEDPSLRGLPVVPLAVTMEILAEAASLLIPELTVVGMRQLRAHRWITLDLQDAALEISAHRLKGPGQVRVEARELSSQGQSPVVAEATVVFAAGYPASPPAVLSTSQEPASKWKPERLYADGMFHGPSLRATVSMDRAGAGGASATLVVPDRSNLIDRLAEPRFLLDPVILDNAGQVVAFWSQEILQAQGDIFPYRLEALDCYAPPQPAGTSFECRVQPKHVSENDISSDIEIVDAAGRVHYRLSSWDDRRFSLPEPMWKLRVAPNEAFFSTPWSEPIRAFSGSDELACRRLESLTAEFLESSHGIWLKVLAYGILSRREREYWESFTAVPKRKIEWLLGRCAAKEAVRTLVARHCGESLSSADVEIEPDSLGRPLARGAWIKRLGIEPVVSITHSHGCAAALAATSAAHLVGIDLELRSRPADSFVSAAFTKEEINLLAVLDSDNREDWPLRLWCAKEAVSKGLGNGLTDGIHSVGVRGFDPASGQVEIFLRGVMVDRFPEFRGKTITAYTLRDQKYVFSSVVHQREASL